jgi:hypothetical protein
MTKWIIETMEPGGVWMQRHICFELPVLLSILEILIGGRSEKIRTIRITRVD